MKTAYTNGIILDGTRDMEPVRNKTVLVEDEKITAIVDRDHPLDGYEIVDLNNAYLIPGLINMHVHLAASGKPPTRDKKPTNYKRLFELLSKHKIVLYVLKKMLSGYAEMELLSGVTTLRTVAGILDLDGQIRDEINAGKLRGPRILSANTGISVPGGHFAGSIATEAESPEMAREHVRMIAATRPDLIKLMITGGVMDSDKDGEPGVLRMSPEIVKAACEEAHKLGYKVAAHVESPEGVKVALENGVDTVEHGAMPDAEIIALFKQHHAHPVCTISPALPYAEFDLSESHAQPVAKRNGKIVMDGGIACMKECLKNGIAVGLGNDVGCPFVLHYNFWRELYYYQKYIGVSAKEALYTATLNNAEILGIEDITGSIEPGKCADMIVVKENPLEDICALRNVSMVIVRGKRIENPRIRKNKAVDDLLDRYM